MTMQHMLTVQLETALRDLRAVERTAWKLDREMGKGIRDTQARMARYAGVEAMRELLSGHPMTLKAVARKLKVAPRTPYTWAVRGRRLFKHDKGVWSVKH